MSATIAQPRNRLDIDCAIVLALLASWVVFATWVTKGERGIPEDVFRDMAYAQNIFAGRL